MPLLLFTAFFGFGYILTPALAAYSWLRWSQSQRRRSRKVRASLAALAISSAAVAFGLLVIGLSSRQNHAFLYLAPAHRWVQITGLLLAGVATLAALVGALQDNPLRLKAVAVSLGSLVLWMLAGSGS